MGFLAGMLALAAVIRLLLAACGSPYSNSDEATIGLIMADILRGTAHSANLFELTTDEVDRRVPAQLAGLIATRDPRFAGYTSATIAGYVVFYYAGA
jgi:hypothetical protein